MAITDPQSQSSYGSIEPNVVTVPDAPIGGADNQRIYPRQLSSGSLRGTQNVGYGHVKIDGSNDQIVIGTTTNSLGQQAQTITGKLSNNPQDQSFGLKIIAADGRTVVYGLLSDGSPGMQITDSSGFVLFKLTGQTWYWYDKNYNTNTMQVGRMPDGSYAWATVPPSRNVQDAF